MTTDRTAAGIMLGTAEADAEYILRVLTDVRGALRGGDTQEIRQDLERTREAAEGLAALLTGVLSLLPSEPKTFGAALAAGVPITLRTEDGREEILDPANAEVIDRRAGGTTKDG